MKIIDGASVKVMRSYDYCHFEVALSVDDGHAISAEDVDEMRKEAMRLADKAVEQYKIAKRMATKSFSALDDLRFLSHKAEAILENYPKSEWNDEQKAIIKRVEDLKFIASRHYDYEDDWNEDDRP